MLKVLTISQRMGRNDLWGTLKGVRIPKLILNIYNEDKNSGERERKVLNGHVFSD